MKRFDYRLKQYSPALVFLFAVGVVFPYAWIALALLAAIMILDTLIHL